MLRKIQTTFLQVQGFENLGEKIRIFLFKNIKAVAGKMLLTEQRSQIES